VEILQGGPSVTEDPQRPATDHSNEGFLDRELDRVVEKDPGPTDAIDNMMVPGFDGMLNKVLSDLDAEARDDKAMLAEFEKRPDAEAPGVSVQPLTAADKTFNDHEVVAVARDCCLILQRARWSEQPELGEAVLSPELEEQLSQAISSDVATHRHHLTPGLEIDDARIINAVLAGGNEEVTVRLTLRGEQVVRDDRTTAIVEGSDELTSWEEDWTLTRDPRQGDTGGQDEALVNSGQWFVAHQGWIVTRIQPVNAPPSEAPPLLS
jgi:hypothetical protein